MPQTPADGPTDNPSSSSGDRIFLAAFLVAVVFIAFVAGAVLTTAGVPPGPQIANAYQGGRALYEQTTTTRDVYRSDLWYPERRPDKGVTVHDADRAQDGFTLYTSGHEAAAFLIGMDGQVIHQWSRPFSTVWNETARVKNPLPDQNVYFRKAMVYPNGDLLAIYEAAGDTPYGYGAVKLDKDSNVIWSYLDHTHHDIDIGPDGRIYLLTHEFVDTKIDGFDNLARPRLDDFLVVLSPEGEELVKVSLIDAMARSEFRQMLHTVTSYAVADPLHANTVDYITAEDAVNFAPGEEGQVMLSFRELQAIVVLDLPSETVTWARRSEWLGQHDPDILPNGNILLFDNYGNYDRPNARSRVLEYNPRNSAIVWEYGGTPDDPLDSMIRSSQQALANGNTLITESSGGRLLEVTRQGEIVWEYVNPVRGGEGEGRIPIVCWGQRIMPDDLDESFTSTFQASQTIERTPA
ncbi:arylsulfotransferase family protein [Lutibaculum baratangense]|uniref:Arylsulfotransferase ASST n=1 Tax=Lutibaculum baratangense AMV1 TaxID=631454 RepID=V4R932_9HYPH|nr:arylsulfotransferase family protein [Lutibaculum baratangense]ESR22706.1 hypothetical protein N177_3843 [Lutibaculum baratangense AMV1]